MEEKSEHLEMAKALYQFKATIAKTLSFKEGEYFMIYQATTKQRNWWQVINTKAQVGFVPSNYVISVQVTPEFISKFLEECISTVRKECENGGGVLTNDRQELLLKLVDRKEQVEKLSASRIVTVPAPPDFLGSPTSSNSSSKVNTPTRSNDIVRPIQSAPLVSAEKKGKAFEKPATPAKLSNVERISPPPKPVIQAIPIAPKPLFHPPKPVLQPPTLPKPVLPPPSKADINGVKKISSQIGGQVGPPLGESRKSISSISSDIEEIQSANGSRKSSSQENELISEETVYQLVEQVRCHTELSHELSRVAVNVVLTDLEKYIPGSVILKKMLALLQGPINVPQPMIEQTHDAKRLNVIFSELTSCKDDAQQRSWMLHEDEDVIVDYIKELTSILMNADASICRHVISSDQYAGVLALTQYYQMEVRWSIRQPLLQALGVLCSLDRAIINLFLTSVLPMELARDMKSNPRNIPKLNYSALLLTMIFSMGEPMPITHLEHLGLEFISFVFNHIEDPPDTDADDQIPDLFVTLVLSYNLQFKTVNDNVLIKAISERSVAKTFTEKILLLLNREDDPVRIFDHEPVPPHSVLKLFIDLFSNTSSASLFYTNDVKVLIDIIVRQLADLSPGDPRRHQYLELCRVVMRNSGYSEHHHRKDDLLKSFTRIFCEETEVSLKDQQLVREISNEFPQYFKS